VAAIMEQLADKRDQRAEADDRCDDTPYDEGAILELPRSKPGRMRGDVANALNVKRGD
jgi:hypothetical protein